jgi:ABC-type antimicrobial peptide transport system permease subunit
VIGLGLVLAIAQVLGNALYLVRGEHNGLLYGVTTTDPVALGGALAGLILVAAVSGVVPARAAARLDPLVALRAE